MITKPSWKLVSLYTENQGQDVYVSFAHYTGNEGHHGGSEYDITLKASLPVDKFQEILTPHLEKTVHLKRYFIKNRANHQEALLYAPSAQEACERCGWLIGDCYGEEYPRSAEQ